jgi:osmotically-inducible protein OsmY
MNKITTSFLVGLLVAHSASSLAEKSSDSSSSQPSTVTQPDNSKSNKVDASNRVTTAQDQSNNPADIDLTKKIRRSVTSDESLSTYAHNVKIVTVDGRVTLNGVVKSQSEKSAVENKAFDIAGKAKVTSELKVAPGG